VVGCVSAARNAIIVIIASSMASVLYHNDINKFTLTGNITSGIPTFKAPSFTLTHDNHTYSVQDFFQVSNSADFHTVRFRNKLVKPGYEKGIFSWHFYVSVDECYITHISISCNVLFGVNLKRNCEKFLVKKLGTWTIADNARHLGRVQNLPSHLEMT